MNRWLRRIAVPVGLSVAAVGIAIPLTVGGSAASAAAAPTSLSALTGTDQPAGAPSAFKTALKTAWASPDGQRVTALLAVLDQAVAGDYGDQAKARATKVRARLAKMDPAVLKDVEAAIELPKDQRQAAFKAIKDKATSGGYGEQVQKRAHLIATFLKHRRG